jgi:hypothetical protein
LLLALGVGALILALVGVSMFLQPRTPVVAAPTAAATAGATTGAPATSAPAPQPADPSAAVQGFLEALASGDAAAALSYAAAEPEDTTMLNNAVLGAALQRAPLRDIQVAKSTGSASSQTIDASYRLGDRVVNASFPVTRTGADWRLEEVAATVNFASLLPDRMALRVNGAALTGDTATLFPGVYAVVPEDSRYAVSHGVFAVSSPGDRPDTYSLALRLSTHGRSVVRAAAHKKLKWCVRQRSLKPAGCGFSTRLPSGNTARKSTVRWTITKGRNAMKSIKPTIALDDPRLVRASTNVQLKVTLRSTNGRSWYGYNAVYSVQAALSGDKVVVRFG